jgi:predicted Rdx family selenoprotein
VKAWIEARGHGPVEVRPGESGQFDLLVGDKLLYSRARTGRFPREAELEKIEF